jgi:hypothetical protein
MQTMMNPSQDMTFKIQGPGPVSEAFLAQGISDFKGACRYVQQLPYRRNSHKDNVLVAMQESCGTCSTKHALLKTLAQENNGSAVQLRLGIYRLHQGNAAAVGPILAAFNLKYLPEAHWFLRIGDKIHDYTFPAFTIPNLEQELLHEIEVQPEQMGAAKDQIHRDFLVQWLAEQHELQLDMDALWLIREKCIFALSST